MRHTLALDVFGPECAGVSDLRTLRRVFGTGRAAYKALTRMPWVARIGADGSREFLRPTLDYSNSNSDGSRGVVARFYPNAGTYEVCEYVSWSEFLRYQIRIQDDGTMKDV